MFSSGMQENREGKMTITGYSAEAVEHFLAYLYTGRFPSETNAMEVFSLSAIYEVPRLNAMCERIILSNLEFSNAYEIFSLGHFRSSSKMKLKAFEVLKEVLPGKKMPDWLVNHPESVKMIVEAVRKFQTDKEKIESELDAAWKTAENLSSGC